MATAMTIRRKPRGGGHERYPEILDAAQRLFAEEGPSRTTMRRVATEAGLSVASLYIYFRNKEAILTALRDRTLAEMRQLSYTATNGVADPETRLRRHLRAYLDYAQNNPDSYRLTFRSLLMHAPAPGRPTTPEETICREDFDVMVAEIAALIQPEYGTDKALVHAVTETAWAFIHGLSSLVIDVPDYPTSGIDACFEHMMTMILAGIKSRYTWPSAPVRSPRGLTSAA